MEDKTVSTFEEQPSYRSPLRSIFNIFLSLIIILAIVYGLVITAPAFDPDASRKDFYMSSAATVSSALRYLCDFFKPIAQLAVILLVAEWALNKFGINIRSSNFKFDWNIQTVIAVIIVSSFSLAALGGVGDISALKDVVLVVVGFYFGSQKKTVSVKDSEERIIQVSEEGPASSVPNDIVKG